MPAVGWDGPARLPCPGCGNPAVAVTPAGNGWCNRCLVSFGATLAEAGDPLLNAGYHTGYRAWSVQRLLSPKEFDRLLQEAVAADDLVAVSSVAPPRLVGAGYVVWLPGVRAVATCTAGGVTPCASPCREYGHGCGWYCWKDPADLYADGHFQRERGGNPLVYGEVAVWGRVYEHRLGYRGLYAYPQALWLPPEYVHHGTPAEGAPYERGAYEDLVHLVAAQYGIPVEGEPLHGDS